VFSNKKLVGQIKNYPDGTSKGDRTKNEYPIGEAEGSFFLGDGEKEIEVYLPWSVKLGIKEISVEGESFVSPVKKEKKCLIYGDSITQGCGTPINGYAHWNAVLSQKLPRENAYWNLGYGYARASDAASNGAWLFKAKQNDYVAVCFGVNDIFHEYAAEGANSARNIKRSLNDIVDFLHASNVKVLVQTVPPFDYPDHLAEIWREVNAFIRNELIQKAEAVFDCVPVLSTGGPDCPTAAYCGHPNVEGSAKWAEALLPAMESFLAL